MDSVRTRCRIEVASNDANGREDDGGEREGAVRVVVDCNSSFVLISCEGLIAQDPSPFPSRSPFRYAVACD